MFRYPFVRRSCPVCGRPLEIREEYLGRIVVCPHCQGEFFATEEEKRRVAATPAGRSLLDRADRLLALTSRQLARRAVVAP